jgi:protein involved in sex pheromone biosynthesis
MIMRKAAILTLTAALALAACNSKPAEKLPEDNVVEVDNTTENANVAIAPPAENVTNVTAKPASAPGFTDEQQMHDDADASGMTARLPDEVPVSGNQTAPAK